MQRDLRSNLAIANRAICLNRVNTAANSTLAAPAVPAVPAVPGARGGGGGGGIITTGATCPRPLSKPNHSIKVDGRVWPECG